MSIDFNGNISLIKISKCHFEDRNISMPQINPINWNIIYLATWISLISLITFLFYFYFNQPLNSDFLSSKTEIEEYNNKW